MEDQIECQIKRGSSSPMSSELARDFCYLLWGVSRPRNRCRNGGFRRDLPTCQVGLCSAIVRHRIAPIAIVIHSNPPGPNSFFGCHQSPTVIAAEFCANSKGCQ